MLSLSLFFTTILLIIFQSKVLAKDSTNYLPDLLSMAKSSCQDKCLPFQSVVDSCVYSNDFTDTSLIQCSCRQDFLGKLNDCGLCLDSVNGDTKGYETYSGWFNKCVAVNQQSKENLIAQFPTSTSTTTAATTDSSTSTSTPISTSTDSTSNSSTSTSATSTPTSTTSTSSSVSSSSTFNITPSSVESITVLPLPTTTLISIASATSNKNGGMIGVFGLIFIYLF